MENDDVKHEFEKLRKEIEDLKRQNLRHERILKQLSTQLTKTVKQFKSLKEATRHSSGAIESIKGVLRNLGR